MQYEYNRHVTFVSCFMCIEGNGKCKTTRQISQYMANLLNSQCNKLSIINRTDSRGVRLCSDCRSLQKLQDEIPLHRDEAKNTHSHTTSLPQFLRHLFRDSNTHGALRCTNMHDFYVAVDLFQCLLLNGERHAAISNSWLDMALINYAKNGKQFTCMKVQIDKSRTTCEHRQETVKNKSGKFENKRVRLFM